MMIVLFHVLYLFGKYVYRNYKLNRRKAVDDAEMDAGEQFTFSRADYMMIDPEAPQDFTAKPLRFFPPAYVQRYVAVSDVLSSSKYSGKLRKVVDFGCSEFGFLVYLKNTPGVEEILCVDIDKHTLETYQERAAPLLSEHIHTRSTPLVIEVCEGSVTHNDKKLENTDAVICIELIEHLYPDTLSDLPQNIFGFIKPKVAVMTTPNADFNVLFPNFSGFRHPDHKFEWTRQEFQDWATNITLKYPEYDVTFDGICKGPEGTEHLGACTQMAIFHRLSDYRDDCIQAVEGLFNTITVHEYPRHVDNRSDEAKILDEATFYIRRISFQDPDMEEEVPLKKILGTLRSFSVSEDTLRTILEEAGWSIVDRESGPTILIPPPSWSSCSAMEGERWSVNSPTNEDDWEDDPGPPTHSNMYLEEDWNTPNWDEELSIVIPQNNSVVQENTYLFDGDNVTLDSSLDMRGHAASAVSIETSIRENLEPSLQFFRNVDRMSVDDLNESFEQNVPVDLNESVVPSNSSFSMKVEEMQEDSVPEHIQSPTMREDTVQQLNHMLHYPVCINISRASTSPEPYLLQTVKMDQDLKHASLCSESMSDWMLNNSLGQRDETQEPLTKNDSIDYDNLRILHLNASHKECESSSPEAVNSNRNASTCVRDPSTKDQLSNSSVSLASCSLADSQPQFTSSPKVETKMNATGKKRRSLNLCDQTNSLPSTIKRLQLIGLESNNSLESSSRPLRSDEEEVASAMTLSADYVKKDTSSDTTQADSSVSTATSMLNDSQTMEESACDKKFQLADLQLIKQECGDVNSTKTTCHYAKDTNSKHVSPTSEEVAGTVQSTSVLKSEKQDENVAESRTKTNAVEVAESAEPKPFSPETPPTSWSPEVMDSGYPNSASVQDMTPEYDLSSIAQDHISDSEPPSIAEAPRPEVLEVVEVVEVENGDLANNNRDGEGNNMMAAQLNELEDLQPLIDVLENDLENENDIYALENDFPMWLLRILNMANPIDVEMQIRERREIRFPDRAGGDDRFMNMERDEGFDSSSSDGSDLENHEMGEDDNSDENVAMDSENASHSDSGSDRWPAGRT
ncbi:hen1 methyltransferase [Halictus rubicundus]|uniref:hen1 methyltransferase n=1 Tax=Halictus rubicundus TaxID=77578 RepID=UPI004036CFF2